MPELIHEYPSVNKDGAISYGGSQSWASSHAIERCGCGLVAAADVLLYLYRHYPHGGRVPELETPFPIPNGEYEKLLKKLDRCMPIIPPFGMTGVSLALGLNISFMRCDMPYRVRWGVMPGNIWERMRQMLENDVPVILAIGPNFPLVWQKNRVPFYVRTATGYVKQSSAKSHYVTVTGMDEEYLRISSWGRMYYVSRAEYEQYARSHSNYVVTNIAYIQKKRGAEDDTP